ncbi:putative odorant-binding protein A10 [Copidosoma floridanum]|uniref:putative odorant-binding protein A10 n=1 Tax=Copidosoma floridanum TaxID=29053 RepID=UPI0006C982F0|nr:putative odorant-binding protein A10 [Copidosoma floridanum]
MATRNTTSALLALVLLVILATAGAQDITNLLQNNQIVDRELRCVLKTGPCDVIGRMLQRMLPELINNDCRRCSPQQRQQANQIASFMKQHYPNEFQAIKKMYSRSA